MKANEQCASNASPLCGLVLAGGRSRRMGKDKAQLKIHAEPQALRAARLLDSVCDATFISMRAGQTAQPWADAYPRIEDQIEGIGPLGGILAALNYRQEAAWLVLACDLPFVDRTVLDQLIAGRDQSHIATAYRSAMGQLPEPLCAIYEPQSRQVLEEQLAEGIRCPRKILINSKTMLLDLPDPDALANLNTPADLELALDRLRGVQDETA